MILVWLLQLRLGDRYDFSSVTLPGPPLLSYVDGGAGFRLLSGVSGEEQLDFWNFNCSDFNVLMTDIMVFEGAESNKINFI